MEEIYKKKERFPKIENHLLRSIRQKQKYVLYNEFFPLLSYFIDEYGISSSQINDRIVSYPENSPRNGKIICYYTEIYDPVLVNKIWYYTDEKIENMIWIIIRFSGIYCHSVQLLEVKRKKEWIKWVSEDEESKFIEIFYAVDNSFDKEPDYEVDDLYD